METTAPLLRTLEHPAPRIVPTNDATAVLGLLPELTTPVDDPAFLQAAARAGRLLPSEVYDALCGFADEPPESGALVLRGLPVGHVPATPPSPRQRRPRIA